MIEYRVQEAIYNALTADAPLNALITGIYDNVPQGTSFPYVTVGDSDCFDWSADDFSGMTISATIHSWSRDRGRAEIKTIQGAIYTALHRSTLTVTGYEFLKCDFQESQTFVDQDGLTRHGIQIFSIMVKEV